MQKGVALILTIVLVAIGMGIVLGLTSVFISSLAASRNIHLSTVTFYIGESGVEGALYADRIGGGLVDGFTCNTDGPSTQINNENGDTCLNELDSKGYYNYMVTGVSPSRKIVSQGKLFDVGRTIEVSY